MSKKVSIPTSVDAQIRTRARNLPIHKCYVNGDWEETQMANIIITRKHINDNYTIGVYLVDLRLYGVKDCFYNFNESPLQLENIFNENPDRFEECDYALAHNIIHAGLEFAEDYGFKPHKNFKTAQFILEEDTDDIPLMEIPLGEDGIPVLEVRHGENKDHEIAKLNKTADGNFRVVYFDKDGNPEPIEDERTYYEIIDEIVKIGFDEYFSSQKHTKSELEYQVFIDLLYMMEIYTKEEKDQIDEIIEKITKDNRLKMGLHLEQKDYNDELEKAYKFFDEEDIKNGVAEFNKVIDKYFDDPFLWDILLYEISLCTDEIDEEVVNKAYSIYPNHPTIKAWYAEWLAQEERFEEIFELFGNKSGLDALTTENEPISPNAFVAFNYAYAMAWLDKKDVLQAEPYYQIITRLNTHIRLGSLIMDMVCELKNTKISELAEKFEKE